MGDRTVELAESENNNNNVVALECPPDCSTVVEHLVIFRPWFMRPWLWSQLPEELLELVIARLPVAQIDGLRALSKSWRCNMSPHSHFKRQLCGEARPKLFALMRADPQRGKIRFKLFDSRSSMWHNCEYHLAREYRQALSVADGGLVCFVPVQSLQQLPILVCNPLTNEWRELPFPAHVRHKPRMIQLRVENQLGSYRLILVGTVGPDLLGAEVYDSAIQKWETLTHGSVTGYVDYRLQFDGYNPSRGESLGVYDCGKRLLAALDCCDDKTGVYFSAALKDRVFVLEGTEIVALQGPEYMDSRSVIKLPKQTGRGKALDLNYGALTALHACNGLLLVTEGAGFASKHPEKEWRVGYGHRFYLYDMSRGTWWTLPSLEKEYDVYSYNARDVSEALMCKLNWWARP